jgi:hypothetical protein
LVPGFFKSSVAFSRIRFLWYRVSHSLPRTTFRK